MLDGQFAGQNGAGAPAPGISVIVAPPGRVAASDQCKLPVTDIAKPKEKKFLIDDNLTHRDRFVLCVSEFCATAIVVFIGCSGCVVVGGEHSLLNICLMFGLAVMISVQCFAHISGSHLNPLVTIAAATLGTFPLIHVPLYFVGQVSGALAGFGLLRLVTPSSSIPSNSSAPGACSPSLNPNVTEWQGLLVEFSISFLLTLVCCAVWDVRNKTRHDSVPIKFGLTITGLALAAGPYTGGNMNPARSFAPALINNDWEHHWIYWIGPLAAGFLGALFYKYLFWQEPEDEQQGNAAEVIPLHDK